MSFLKRLTAILAPLMETNISTYAAACCYYLILSVVPAGALIFSLLPYLPLSQDFWTNLLQSIFPQTLLPVIAPILSFIFDNRSITVLSLSALVTLWSASKGIMALMEGLNSATNAPSGQSFIKRRLRAVLYFILIGFAVFLVLISTLLSSHILTLLFSLFPNISSKLQMLYRIRILNSTIILTSLFAIIYRILPAIKLPWSVCIKSALVVSVSWISLSGLFSYYVSHYSNYSQVYGKLGSMLLTAIWLQICINLLLYGGRYAYLHHRENYCPLRHFICSFHTHKNDN